MKARVKYSFEGFKTRKETTVLIGGDENYCRERYGYRQSGKGISPAYVPVQAEPRVRLANMQFAEYCPALGFTLFISVVGQVIRWNTDEYSKVSTAAILNSNYPFVIPCAEGDVPTYAAIGGTKIAIFKGGEVSTHTLPYRVLGGTYHCGRIFAVDKDDPYIIRWSGFELRNWSLAIDVGGHMRVNPKGGKVFGIVELGEKLVLVRENALTVFNALADARHSRMVQYGSTFLPAVINKTWVVVGGKLWLCTSEGLNVFDGEKLTRVQVDTCGKNLSYEKAAVFNDRYLYLTCKENGVRCFLEYDTLTGETATFGSGCDLLFAADDGIYCLAGDKATTVSCLTEGLADPDRVWTSENIDLGTDRVKTLKNLTVEGEGDSEIEIECDGRRRVVEGCGRTYVGETGVNFIFRVRGAGTVSRLAAEWEVRK